jgi:hypothetical protein
MPTIYLDCDGVLADFDRGAERVLGLGPRAYERRFGLGRFWAALAAAPDFFGTLDLMPDALDLFEAVRAHDPVILTGLPRGTWAEPQKRAWAARHFPGVHGHHHERGPQARALPSGRRARGRPRPVPRPLGRGRRGLHPSQQRRRLDRGPAGARLHLKGGPRRHPGGFLERWGSIFRRAASCLPFIPLCG